MVMRVGNSLVLRRTDEGGRVASPRSLTQLTGKRATPRSEPCMEMPTISNFIANYTKIKKPQHITRYQINPCPLVKLKLLYKILYKIFLLVLSRRFARPLAHTEHPDLSLDIVLLAVSYNTKLTQVYYILYKNSKLLNSPININPRAFR